LKKRQLKRELNANGAPSEVQKALIELATNENVGNRMRLAAQLAGMQFGGARDLYTVLGYSSNLTSEQMYNMYRRGDIAKPVVNAYPDACFRADPEVYDDENTEKETVFEKAVTELNKRTKLWHYCHRADRLAGVGRYSLLILGVNDGQPTESPLGRANDLAWLKTVTEKHAQIATWDNVPTSPNFGKPLIYNVTIGAEGSAGTQQRRFHYSRVIHIAEDCDEDDVYGTPRIESVFNRLFDLQKVAGGSAEMFWLSARMGLQFVAAENANMTEAGVEQIREQFEEYSHQLRRLLTAKNGKWEAMESQVADPTGNFNVLIDLIAAATRIPRRILMGNEAGELGSSQDETNFIARVDERRRQFVVPFIVRAVIDRLIGCGALPNPKAGGYDVAFPAPPVSPEKQAQAASSMSSAIGTYAANTNAQMIVPVAEFRELIGLPAESPYDLPDEVDDVETVEVLPAVGETENVQAAALNGAQMASLQAIAQAVADGMLPADTARMLVAVSVPGITPAQIAELIDPAEKFANESKANGNSNPGDETRPNPDIDDPEALGSGNDATVPPA
jgi:hypothetical protein